MLILSRKKGESIVINGNIEVTVVEVDDDKIKLGFDAPKDVSILRKEIYLQILEENRNALKSSESDMELLKDIIKKSHKKDK